ncbi:MAG: DoxX family protein [Elusimicrobiota bacterium]
MQKDDVLSLVGRLFMAMIFLASAFGKVTNFEGTTRFMESHGLGMASLLCGAAVVVEALGAISLILGYQVRWSAAALVCFLAATTWIFHVGPIDQRVHLLKNLAIMGGLFQLMAFGPGDLSLEGRGRSW